MNSRDERNQRKGYQEALRDIMTVLSEGGVEDVIEWVRNNGDKETLAHAEALIMWAN